MRFDLAFLLCCCKAFLGPDDEEENYYDLLAVDSNATAEEIKKAYKRQSLQMHPDKLAQRGKTVTAEDQAKFTRMKEAYEVLSDPHKRQSYDAIGEKGMKYMDEPFSIDPQQLVHNFANSSVIDRSKIFSIFLFLAVAVLIWPILLCLQMDGKLGSNASWFATMTPIWIWNVFIFIYHWRVISMGPITKPDHVSDAEWVDPLPMKKRIWSLARFCTTVLFEVFVALKLDKIWNVSWIIVFVPLYISEVMTLYKRYPMAKMRIVTVDDLESALGKPFSEFTDSEKTLIGQRYSVVQSTSSPDFDAAQKLKSQARIDMVRAAFRIIFVLALLIQLETTKEYSWWLVFLPVWVLAVLMCYFNYQAHIEVQKMATEKDPTLFGQPTQSTEEGGTYGAMATDGVATPASPLTPAEQEELKAQVLASSSRMCSRICSTGFMLFIVVLLVVKLQGASYSALWIISPFLAMVRKVPIFDAYSIVNFVLTMLGCEGRSYPVLLGMCNFRHNRSTGRRDWRRVRNRNPWYDRELLLRSTDPR